MNAGREPSETDVAIIGMAGHFPGAPDVDELWRRVRNGDDCLRDLSLGDLDDLGVRQVESTSPGYVRRAGVIDAVEDFDPAFFGIGPRDAAIMDPQHRHFLECAWEALEAGGVVPERFEGAIGVFAGCGMNTYLINNLLPNGQLLDQLGWFLLRHTGNDKDFLATTLSYRLDLRGPSVNVQTACSTSLVAVHLAVQSLLAMECDVALAGGSTIEVPHGVGYRYHEGEILSPDGYCRAFDARSQGTVLTSGAGVVALRRLADAWDARDPILAVVNGTAVNNDGARKVSYLAPSVDGHADVVKEALSVAGIGAREIQLLEAHGTGTPVGDPIEVAALTEAFRATTSDTGFCRLTSTKPNIGHLDTAAGVASLIKVVQALRHQTLPPIANHTEPSPLLDLDRTPFVLSGTATEWPRTAIRRAGVSSLGVGGTNAHVVVEEAPDRGAPPPTAPEQVLMLSGRDARAVAETAERLATHLETHADLELADVAHTLTARRRHHPTRRVVTATDRDGAINQLRQPNRVRTFDFECSDTPPRITFLFPGGGSQYQGMATGLDERFSVFHDVMSDGIARVRELSDVDIGAFISGRSPAAGFNAPTVSLPAVFLTSLGLARQWMEWGIRPDALIGHSLGEYVAAHLAGVLTFDDAVKLVVCRASLMERVGGDDTAMLVVPLGEERARQFVSAGVSLAVVNTDDECVLAGRSEEIDEIAQKLSADDTPGTLIPLAAAAHSVLLDPVVDAFKAVVTATPLSPPGIRYMSNHTGTWITAEQATDPDYWVRHLRHTVRFADNLRMSFSEEPTVAIELGPGHSLSSYARRCAHPPIAAIPALRHPRQQIDDTAFTLHAFAQQWAVGASGDFERLIGGERRCVTLPTYPFQRQRHWHDPPAREDDQRAQRGAERVDRHQDTREPGGAAPAALSRVVQPADMWWEIDWEERDGLAARGAWHRWWVLATAEDPLADQICAEMETRGWDVGRLDASTLSLSDSDLGIADGDAVVMVGSDSVPPGNVDAATSFWLGSGIDVARLLGGGVTTGHRLAAVTHGAVGVEGPGSQAAESMALGLIRVAPREYPDLDTVMIDVDRVDPGVAATVVDELTSVRGGRLVALRSDRRLTPTLRHLDVLGEGHPPPFTPGGTYLVTGGLGAIGHALAKHLAAMGCNLGVVTGTALPPRSERAAWLLEHGPLEPTSQRLQRLAELEALGARVEVIVADLARPADVIRSVDEVEAELGPVRGAIHAAGTLHDRLIGLVEAAEIEFVVGAKARAAVVLASELERRGSELLVLVSSTSTVLAPPGQVAYVASNAVLDSLAGQHGDLRVVTVNYGAWTGTGMAQRVAQSQRLGFGSGKSVTHPVFEQRTVTGDGSYAVIGHLSTSHHWLLDEHRSAEGIAVLPGTGHLELLLAGSAIALGTTGPVSLASVSIHEALVVPDDTIVAVRVSVAVRGERTFVELESDDGPSIGWHVHSSAEVVEPPQPEMEPGGVEASVGLITADAMERQRSHLRLGVRWQPHTTAFIDDDTAVARLELDPVVSPDHDVWRMHPAVVDVATGLAVRLARAEGSNDLLVPVGYDTVTSYARVPTSVQAVATRRSHTTGTVPKVDIHLYDSLGRGVLAIEGLQLWTVDPSRPLGAVRRDDPVVGGLGSLADLAESLGIRPDEGVALFDQILASGRSRLLASSVDLDQLQVAEAPAGAAGHHEPAHMSIGSQGANALERVAAIWEELLGVSNVLPDDNFFDLGGHSLIAIRLMSRLQRELGVRLQLTDILESPSLQALTDVITLSMPDSVESRGSSAVTDLATADDGARIHRSLVQISAGGTGPPLFIVHGAGGNVLFLWSLARALSGDRSVYGFQAAGVDARDMPDPSIEAMASRYVGELRAAHPGPYLIGGYSGGGVVALEMARQLKALGDDVTQVFLFDSVPPGRAQPPAPAQVRNLLANARRLGWRAIRPFIRRKVAGVYRSIRPRSRSSLEQVEATERALGIVEVEGFVNLYYYFSTTAERYELTTYDVDVTILKAEDIWPIQPFDYHWSRYVEGEIAIRSVPGNHHSMFFPELVPALATAVRNRLVEIEPARAD